MRLPLILVLSLFSASAVADVKEFTLTLRKHRFVPAQLTIPANTKVKLLIVNEDSTPEEFESHDLKREKVIAGKSQATISIGPLKPGTYKFVGEFHEVTAQGEIVAK